MLKMKATPGGGYWLEVEGNLFEVVLDRSQVEGVYGGRLINNREYWCRVNGKRLAGGPYSAAVYAKSRLEPIIERVQRRAEIDREKNRLRQDLDKLFPGGLPENVTEAIEKYPQNESEPDPDPVAGETEDAAESAETEQASEPEPEPVEEEKPEPTPAETAAEMRNSAAPAKRRTSRAKGTTEKATTAKTPAKRSSRKVAEKDTAPKDAPEEQSDTEKVEVAAAASE
jgi:hypothetical protein